MITLKLTSTERWILATAVSRQIGVYSEKIKNGNYSKKERKNLWDLEFTLTAILAQLQSDVGAAE